MSELDKAKATITGSFFRVDKDINNDFTRKSKDSVLVSKKNQSTREYILERLMQEYNEKGDNIFNILKSNPF